ncbi:MAG: WbuC family cupin fold metalloprotein [Lamprobacter sp.]|uniref:WbuC family cupin fold metalloprotein n=1 Tax=Lamprobacter sp. TaxID=3100796 RepID=UPI002B25F749|nr:WbuC family cupin fold metalloprotein [Lamprobacter sp.]MEA3642311.1 WbuC family cupin fold metalloprotein [Lamprobacter sp.]
MTNEKPFPLAIEAPDARVIALTAEMLTKASTLARQSPRGRIIQRLHKCDDAPLHRMFNVMQPGSYARAHRHSNPPKAEAFIVLSGAVRFVAFDDRGDILQCLDMRPGSATFGVDIEPGVWHTLIVLEPDTILFEVKNGPYSPASDKDFADWSPAEDTPESARFLTELIKQTGGMPSGPGR